MQAEAIIPNEQLAQVGQTSDIFSASEMYNLLYAMFSR